MRCGYRKLGFLRYDDTDGNKNVTHKVAYLMSKRRSLHAPLVRFTFWNISFSFCVKQWRQHMKLKFFLFLEFSSPFKTFNY